MSALADQQAVQKKWIHRDNVRGWAAVGISLPVQLLLTVLGVDYLTSLFVFWVIYGIVYAALTLSAFRRVDPADLPGLLRSEAQRTWWIRFLLGGGDGPGFAVPWPPSHWAAQPSCLGSVASPAVRTRSCWPSCWSRR